MKTLNINKYNQYLRLKKLNTLEIQKNTENQKNNNKIVELNKNNKCLVETIKIYENKEKDSKKTIINLNKENSKKNPM